MYATIEEGDDVLLEDLPAVDASQSPVSASLSFVTRDKWTAEFGSIKDSDDVLSSEDLPAVVALPSSITASLSPITRDEWNSMYDSIEEGDDVLLSEDLPVMEEAALAEDSRPLQVRHSCSRLAWPAAFC